MAPHRSEPERRAPAPQAPSLHAPGALAVPLACALFTRDGARAAARLLGLAPEPAPEPACRTRRRPLW
ncbi:hypothetical protein [Streptomyces olivaceus]|uniref:hypothetical protein n=1 Tax=Streptomyces olivaceus TaxID=47716 RepID=UPI001CCDCF1A|nr:hypothetical protein [Streptomyces olivaceus]MBZ6226777.1 hypothetical protein [Streptomyces olivaceus]